MKVNCLRINKLELSILSAAALCAGLPLYLNFNKGWSPFEMQERDMVSVVRSASNSTAALALQQYQLEGVAYASSVRTAVIEADADFSEKDSGDIRLSEKESGDIKILRSEDEGLIEIRDLSKFEPVYSFNERILLVTGKNPDSAVNADE